MRLTRETPRFRCEMPRGFSLSTIRVSFLEFHEGNHFFAVFADGDDDDNDGAYFLFFRLKSLENT